MDRCFEATARIALWRMLRVPNIFTLEASFFGYNEPESLKIVDFTPNSYK